MADDARLDVGGRRFRLDLGRGERDVGEPCRVPQLGDEALALLQRVGREDGVVAELGGAGPIAHRVGAVLVQQLDGVDDVALGLGHLRAVAGKTPAGNANGLPRHRVLMVQRLDDGVEGPGADDLVRLGPHGHGE